MTDEEIDQLEHEERMMVEDNRFDPAPFDPATAPIEVVLDWCCQHVPGLRDSGGIGIPPHDQAGPLTYCEGRLYFLLGEVLRVKPVSCNIYLPEDTPAGECHVIVDIYAGWGGAVLHGQGEARCAWGDPKRMPAKEARLRAAADMLLKRDIP